MPEVGRDPRTLGVTALIGLWFPDLRPDKPVFLDNPLTGTPDEIATAMRGFAALGMRHISSSASRKPPNRSSG